MHLAPVEPNLAWGEYVVLRLLRRWTAGRTGGANALPDLVALVDELREPREAAIALDSVFQLTESCLGRTIETECCCSPSMSADERAVLALIAAAPVHGPPLTSTAIPHGLPSALCWAAVAARRALGVAPAADSAPSPAECPFPRAEAVAAL